MPCSCGIRIKVRRICRRCLPQDFDKLFAKTKIDVGEAISPKISHALIRTLSGLRSLWASSSNGVTASSPRSTKASWAARRVAL